MWCQFSGHIDVADLNNATNDFYDAPLSDNITNVLWDFSAMTSFDVSPDAAKEIAFTDHVASQYMKPMKAAFITSDAEFSILANQYIDEMKQLKSRWTNRLFSSLAEAQDWLSST